MKAKKVTRKKSGKRAKKRIKTPARRAKKSVKKAVKLARRHLSTAKKISGLPICERLAHLLTRTSIVIYAAKPAGDYAATFVSDNIKRMTGYTFRPFVNRPGFWLDHVHPDDRERVLSEVESVFDSDYHEYEYRFRHKKGHYIWVHDEMRLIRGPKGKPKEIVGYWTDVTRRKKYEKDLATSAESIRQFMDSAVEGFVLLDSEFRVIGANKYVLEKFGYTHDKALGTNILDISQELWESGRYEKYREIMETGKPGVFDDVIAPDQFGNKRLILRVFKVGEGLGMIVQDVTEEKRRAAKSQENEARLRSLLESTNIGVVIHDLDGIVTLANERACELLDTNVSELVGMSIVAVCDNLVDADGNKIPEAQHPVTLTVRTKQPVTNTIVGLASDELDGERWLLVNTDPIIDAESGELDEVLCSFIDITEKKYIEDQLAESGERYRQIFENCPIGIGISDMDGRVITANTAMQHITGYSLAEFQKITLADTFESAEERERMLTMLSKKGQVINYRIRLRRRDGTPYDAVLNISCIEIGGKIYHHTMCHAVTP